MQNTIEIECPGETLVGLHLDSDQLQHPGEISK
jgi:hypothetical protein